MEYCLGSASDILEGKDVLFYTLGLIIDCCIVFMYGKF